MNHFLTLFCLLLILFCQHSFAQKSLDSLRLVLPVGINGDELILSLKLNKEKSILKIKTDKQDVFFEISTRKQIPSDLVFFNSKYSAKELRLNLREPSDNLNEISENVSIDKGHQQTYDSVAFSREFVIIRAGMELIYKNHRNKVSSQIKLSGLGNFRLYQCQYFKCEDFYFVIPWGFGSIQNSIIVINVASQSIAELSGKLLQTTAIETELTQNVLITTRDAGDFTEHQGRGELLLNLLNPLAPAKSKRFGRWNPNYFNDVLEPFYSADYKFLIKPEALSNGYILFQVIDSNQEIVFSHQMNREDFKKIYEFIISDNLSNCAISSMGSVIRTYEINQKKLFKINEFLVFEFCKLELMSNGDLIIFDIYEWSALDTCDFYIIKNYSEISKVKVSDLQGLYGYSLYDDNCVVIPDSGNVVIYNLNNKNREVLLSGGAHNDMFTFDKTCSALIYYKESERTIRIFDSKSKQLVYSIYPLLNNNWLVKPPNSPYYMCSKGASKMLHYVSPNLNIIGFEQLDPIYNRPDIVLDSLGKYFGNADQGMIDEYRKAWEKRIERLGLNKEQLGKGEFAVPNAEIVGADEIDYENINGQHVIKVVANDPKYTLHRFNVFVNEVPLYGSKGISIAQLKRQSWDTTVSVPLSLGDNKIQVSVINELGLENFKYPIYIHYTPSKDSIIVPKTHFIGIGVNRFQNPGHDLNYCVKDVEDLSRVFDKDNAVVKLLTDNQATRENILRLKKYLRDSTTVHDKVVISCSSHGLLDDAQDFYLATHDVDFDNPKTRGLKYEELEGLLDSIPARKKLMLLDACHSGEIDKSMDQGKQVATSTNMQPTTAQASRNLTFENAPSDQTSFQKMAELFVNVRNNTGSVIISAAGGTESALEGVKIDNVQVNNGAFTYAVLEFFKRHANTGHLTVNQLKQFVETRVEEITDGAQKPTSRQETMEVDWELQVGKGFK